MWYQNLLKQNRIPDSLIRTGIRFYNRQHLRRLNQPGKETLRKNLLQRLESFPVAAVPEKANEQHYEVPAAFFEKVLGPHLKYSCGFWPTGQEHWRKLKQKC